MQLEYTVQEASSCKVEGDQIFASFESVISDKE